MSQVQASNYRFHTFITYLDWRDIEGSFARLHAAASRRSLWAPKITVATLPCALTHDLAVQVYVTISGEVNTAEADARSWPEHDFQVCYIGPFESGSRNAHSASMRNRALLQARCAWTWAAILRQQAVEDWRAGRPSTRGFVEADELEAKALSIQEVYGVGELDA